MCALSTVGIAASGFALARPDNPSRSATAAARRSTTSHGLPPLSISSSRFGDTRSDLPTPTSAVASSSQSTGLSHSGIAERRRDQRRRRAYTNPSNRLSDLSHQESALTSGRPSSSWRRRLSLISSSHDRPPSRARPTSAHGTFPPAETALKSPNKLVKRATSQHGNVSFEGNRPRTMSTFSLRRPATSHQRDAELEQRVAADRDKRWDMPLSARLPDTDAKDTVWQPYFRSRHNSETRHTIRPPDPFLSRHPVDYPTLMLSTSINSPVDTPLYTPSSLPSEFPRTFPSHDANPEQAQDLPSTDNPPSPRSPSHREDTGLDPQVEPLRPRDVDRPLESMRTQDRRHASNPLPPSSPMYPPRLRRKRNFSDSTALRRPLTAPNGELVELLSQPQESGPNGLSPWISGHGRTASVNPNTSQQSSNATPPSVIRYARVKRPSVTTSDRASTAIGSDDTRIFTSGDEDDKSDSVFDSFRTRISSSSIPKHRGPKIETIFHDFLDDDDNLDNDHAIDSIGSDQDWSATQATSRSSTSSSDFFNDSCNAQGDHFSAKQSDAASTPSPQRVSKDTSQEEPLPSPTLSGFEVEQNNFGGRKTSGTAAASEQNLARKTSNLGTKPSVFDWSEQPWAERDHPDTQHRPSTVDGKQAMGFRSNRVALRKPPSSVHLRSQSVPVSRELAPMTGGRRGFGTWGLGHKGATEDWDGDFEFGDSDSNSESGGGTGEKSANTRTVKVPQAIMERQASVHGQYGQVQELTLLVEELRRLRLQGNKLQVVHGPSYELWKEAEGIVNLATFDEDENNLSPLSPSSRSSLEDYFETTPSPPHKNRKRADSEVRRPPLSVWANPGQTPPPGRRERRDSSAKAKSVLETIYQQRESTNGYSPSQQKVAFDTQSLRDLVVRAGVVTRALKEVIRRAEDVNVADDSPNSSPPPAHRDPPFRRIFDQTPEP